MRYLAVWLCILFRQLLPGQPPVCAPGAEMSSFCVETCVVCNIDGFRGRNSSTDPGEAPDGFCTFIVHNGQWVAFVAGSENLSIRLDVDNCLDGAGLEVAIYAGRNCEDFRQISNCRGGLDPVAGGNSGIFTVTERLVIGQYYYLVMDGNRGDICDWTFTVLEGSTELPPLPESGPVIGDERICPNVPAWYRADPPLGATELEWTLDGVLVGHSDSLALNFAEEGTFELCLTAFNVCNVAPPTCRTLTANAIPPTVLTEFICDTRCQRYFDSTICETGVYAFPFVTAAGCDSLVILDVTFVPEDRDSVVVAICVGDSVEIDGVTYAETGVYVNELTNRFGCDSTLILDLRLIDCNLDGSVTVSEITCHGEKDGGFRFGLNGGTPPFTYHYYRLGGGPTGAGVIGHTAEDRSVSGLGAGTYLVEVIDLYGNALVLSAEVVEPPLLTFLLQSSGPYPWAASCYGAADGGIRALPAGGRPPYAYRWNTGDADADLSGIAAGAYVLTVTDANGCEFVNQANLTEPPPLRLRAAYVDAACDDPENGKVEVLSVSGGVGGYAFAMDNALLDTNRTFTGLSEGLHELRLMDANGCEADTVAGLRRPEIPSFSLDRFVTVSLGESVALQLDVTPTPRSIRWSPAAGISCTDCPDPTITTLDSRVYTVTVSSRDGCLRTDSVRVSVVPGRELYVPTAFSPDGDGVNDAFRLYPGTDTESILTVEVYDRWGQRIWSAPGIEAWDGTYRGRSAATGVYVWRARLRYLDGVEETRAGAVALLR